MNSGVCLQCDSNSLHDPEDKEVIDGSLMATTLDG